MFHRIRIRRYYFTIQYACSIRIWVNLCNWTKLTFNNATTRWSARCKVMVVKWNDIYSRKLFKLRLSLEDWEAVDACGQSVAVLTLFEHRWVVKPRFKVRARDIIQKHLFQKCFELSRYSFRFVHVKRPLYYIRIIAWNCTVQIILFS